MAGELEPADCGDARCDFCRKRRKVRSDVIEHEISADCICGPTAVPVERPDGSVGWQYVHHSLDGRELRETSDG